MCVCNIKAPLCVFEICSGNENAVRRTGERTDVMGDAITPSHMHCLEGRGGGRGEHLKVWKNTIEWYKMRFWVMAGLICIICFYQNDARRISMDP